MADAASAEGAEPAKARSVAVARRSITSGTRALPVERQFGASPVLVP